MDSKESLEHGHNFDQQAKDIMLRNRLQCLSFLVSIGGIIGMNMSAENNMLDLNSIQIFICQTVKNNVRRCK